MRVGGGDAERLRVSRPPPHPPQCAHWGTFPPVGGRLWARSNRGEFGVLWDVWIHILGIGAECACWKAGGHMGPPLRRIRKPSLLFRRGRTLAGPWFRATIRAAPTREGAGTCPLIRPLRGHLPPQGEGMTGGWGHPPLRQGLGKNNGRTMCAPTREGAGNCLLIRPSGRPATDGPKYGQIFYYVTFCDVFSKNSTKAAENIKIFLKTGCVHPGIFLHLQIRFLSNFVL